MGDEETTGQTPPADTAQTSAGTPPEQEPEPLPQPPTPDDDDSGIKPDNWYEG
jgi:hypothetical protein